MRLRSEGIPVRRLLKAVQERTGVRLDAPGPVGDERLVAFVPEATLSEVMSAVAELYRARWTRTGSGNGAAYRLEKGVAAAREEQALRDRALRELLAQFGARLRDPASAPPSRSGRPQVWAPAYADLLPILAARAPELLREGYVYLEIGRLPPAERERIAQKLRPILKSQDELRDENTRALRQQELAMGVPEAFTVREKPPSIAEESTLTLDLHLYEEPRVSVGLRTQPETGTWYNWLEVTGDDLRDEGTELYAARKPRLPEQPGGPAVPGPADDPFHRAVEIPAPRQARAGDWIGTLGRASRASGVAIYADCYHSFIDGGTRHPRGDTALSGRGSAAQVLDAVCFPTGSHGTRKLGPNSFWWRRGNSALVRSRRWLWDTATVLPADLMERMAASFRRSRSLDAAELPGLAALTAFQVQSLGRHSQHMDEWHLAVRVPGRLSLAARQLYLAAGFAPEQLAPADRAALAAMLPGPPEGEPLRFHRPSYQVNDAPAQGGPIASVFYRAPGARGGRPAHFVLPGVGPPPALEPRAPEVALLPPAG